MLTVYHTGIEEIPKPDLRVGRKNADFGQGFYLSDDASFALRWAKERKDTPCVLNVYRFDPNGLRIRRLYRCGIWYDYICTNRAGRSDPYAGYDAVIGPIACDTLYDTWGILTSGMIGKRLAVEAYRLGPYYRQIVLKSEKALSGLCFVSAQTVAKEQIAKNRAVVKQEEQAYQEKMLQLLDSGE
ncbi:MAG: DUF3990 domain-containing protein [Clostridia bacterium]|nr:DUF3990 domain-containing protein [Clostridia bacterium]